MRGTEAHQTDGLAELVCSNSFRSDDGENNAVGLLHEEMRRCGSLIMRAADAPQAAGGRRAGGRPRRLFRRGDRGACRPSAHRDPARGDRRPCRRRTGRSVIIATGPLTSPALAEAIRALTGEDALAFFDAIAPIVHRDSIDFDIAWLQSRYDKRGPAATADYINCPLDEEQYEAFVAALLAGEKTDFKEWEKSTPYFEGCLPIEVMAARGARHAALRADEAGGPERSAQRARGPMRWCSCARTMRWARCGTWWASRPS